MAYNNWNQLSTLLRLLDDERNDIYIHIDKRSGNFPRQLLESSVKSSGITFIERKNVYWADYSQADVEMDLMSAASSVMSYQYYHLLSGMDLPLKTQDEIHAFFNNEHREFIAMTPDGGKYCEKHARYYHFLIHNRFYRTCKPLKAIDRGFMYIQRILGLKRSFGKELKIATGWQWFSITDDFLKYILSQRSYIKKMFSYVLDVDEKFVGTMVNKLGNYDRLFYVTKPGEGDDSFRKGCQRYIDFSRPVPQPYTWGRDDPEKDFCELINSGMLFARKFDERVNQDIIDRIVNYLEEKAHNDTHIVPGV